MVKVVESRASESIKDGVQEVNVHLIKGGKPREI